MDHRVQPASRFYVVQASDYAVELPVEVLIEVLDHLCVVRDLDPGAPLHHELSGNLRFILADIVLPNI